ncbi:methyltransferase family protein [Algirhabdus cladophorae]|uniref:methyltransferase family protein n=1 Tax=Algirhabdus cladophorae TaxID=3377108 RepID=UPI003B8483C8
MNLPLIKMIDSPPVWLAGFAAVAYGQGRLFPIESDAVSHVIGGALVALGLGLMALAFVEFRRHKTTVIPHQTASALITRGIFARTRNPIYLGDALVLAGLCLRWDAVISLILVPVFVLLITQRFILAEEMRLESGFGAEFRQYCQQTRRWV